MQVNGLSCLSSLSDPGGSLEKSRCTSACSRVTVERHSENSGDLEEEEEEAEDEYEEEEEEDEEDEEEEEGAEEGTEEDEEEGVRVVREDEGAASGREAAEELIASSSPPDRSDEGSCSAIGTGMEHRQQATTQRWAATRAHDHSRRKGHRGSTQLLGAEGRGSRTLIGGGGECSDGEDREERLRATNRATAGASA